jgi:pimeloyl-ACP methyl ester carboxylesterase
MAVREQRERPVVFVEEYGSTERSAWLDVDWRRHQRWVTVQGRAINVVEIGPTAADADPDAAPIVWIHGLAGCWQNWLENLPALAVGRRCIAMDLPGFGASELPERPITIPYYAETIAALLDELELPRAVVIGNSMGGLIAAELAITEPARVERLVLVSAAGLSAQDLRDERLLRLLRVTSRALTLTTGWVATMSPFLARHARTRRAMVSVVAAHPDRLGAPLVSELLRGTGKPGFVDALDALSNEPIRDRLGEITAPTLVLWGARDRLVPADDAWIFGEAIPDAQVVVYADTGHLAMLERPGDVNARIAAFLA